MGLWFGRMLTFEVEADEEAIALSDLLRDASGGVIETDDDRVLGGFAAHGSSVREALAPCVEMCGVTLVERGGRLRQPAIASPLAIGADELGCDADGEVRPRMERFRAPESAMPSSLAMTHYDADRDYQAGQMRASGGGGRTRDERVELPAVLGASQAKLLVEQALSRRWRSGDRLRLRLPPSKMGLHAGDAIQLPGSSHAWVARVVTIDCLAVAVEAEAAAVTVQPLPADPGRNVSEPDLMVGRTDLFLFELPTLGEAPAASARIHVAVANEGLWKAVPVEASIGAASPDHLIVARRAVAGRAESMLDPRTPLVIDELSSVRIRLSNASQSLFNADIDALAAGANRAVIGKEIVQFGRAELLEPGIYRLTRLLRGRLGTEWAARHHDIGEPFCLLGPAPLRTIDFPPSVVGADLRCTAYGIGDVTPLPVAIRQITGEAMRPLSPCHLMVSKADQTLTATWVRRSQSGWAWIDGVSDSVDNFPELYRLTVQGPGGDLSIECAECSATFIVADLPAQPGETVTLSLTTIGTFAVSHPTTATMTI